MATGMGMQERTRIAGMHQEENRSLQAASSTTICGVALCSNEAVVELATVRLCGVHTVELLAGTKGLCG